MKVLKQLSAIILLIVVMSSCSVQNGFIQKRKYQKGYHLSLKKKISPPQNKEKETIEIHEENLAIEITTSTNSTFVTEKQIEEEVISKNKATEDLAFDTKKTKSDDKVSKRKNFKINSNKRTSQRKVNNSSIKVIKTSSNISEENNTTEVDIILLYILAVLIPVVAVGLVTDWETKPVIISLLLMILFWIPGVIYALIMIDKNT